MTEDDLIAHAMTSAMRQLLSALVVHHASETGLQGETLANAKQALDIEIQTIGMEAVGSDGEKIDLTDALQESLRIVVDAALKDAHDRLGSHTSKRLN